MDYCFLSDSPVCAATVMQGACRFGEVLDAFAFIAKRLRDPALSEGHRADGGDSGEQANRSRPLLFCLISAIYGMATMRVVLDGAFATSKLGRSPHAE